MTLGSLETEQANPNTTELYRMSTSEILYAINEDDAKIAGVVKQCIPQVARLVDEITDRLSKGGSLYYVGAGTSGRLGVLDASECPPTYGVPGDLVQGIIAGGDSALRTSSEGAEDKPEEGEKDLIKAQVCEKDVVVGLAASGRTPYVIGALTYARSVEAFTGAISCVTHAAISACADVAIEAVTGPEVITGSTRMKAGTAQKMILNMISTCTMVRLGKVYRNYMVDVQPTNEKLRDRAIRIICLCTGCGEDQASSLLRESGNHVKTAILMEEAGLDCEAAWKLLDRNKGRLAEALRETEK